MENFIGYMAAFCTTIAFLPQAIKTIKTKDVNSISLLMYVIFTFGVFFWFLYGIIKVDIPIIVANSITMMLALIILYYKLRYSSLK